MAHLAITNIFSQQRPETPIPFSLFGWTQPPPPVPSFPLMQNISPRTMPEVTSQSWKSHAHEAYMFHWLTRNIHVQLCLVPVCRLCAHVMCGCRCRWSREVRVARVTFVVGLEAVFCVSSIQATMAPPRHRPQPPSPSPKNAVVHPSIWVEHIWMCDAHMAYTHRPMQTKKASLETLQSQKTAF